MLALGSGILTSLAMPGFGAYPVVFVSLVPLFFALEGKPRFFYGILFGAAFFALELRWMLTLYRFSPLVVPGYALVILYSALFLGVFALFVVPSRSTRSGGFLLFGAPAVFVLLEFARAQGPFGNGFSALYQSLYRTPALIQIATVFGPWAITAFIMVVNIAVYLFLRRRRVRYLIIAGGAVATLAAFSLLPVSTEGEKAVRVAIIASNVRQETKLDARNLPALTERYLDLGRRATAQPTDLVVFPESILPAYILRDQQLLVALKELAESGNARILFGTGDAREGAIYNTVALLPRDGGVLGTYAMVRPVPFGEYIPGRSLWEAIGLRRLIDSFLPLDLTPGRAFEPVDELGTPICFESTFPGPARRFVRAGAKILVVVTNDAWFAGSSELVSHFSEAVFRAVETRRYVVQAANGGISGIVDPTGKILALRREEGVLRGTVFARDDRSPYTRWGNLPLLVFLGACVLVFVAARIAAPIAKRGTGR